MYSKEPIAEALRRRSGPRDAPPVSRNVVMLGLTSLFTDVSQEMVSVVLPVYLVYALELSPAAVGASLGVYQSGAALVAIAAGLVADRLRRAKEIALVGYALSAACKLLLLGVGSHVGALTAVVVADRVGKGIRTAPRDALIAASAQPGALGRAFGVHRALDAAGAMLGPLVAFGLLTILHDAFDVLFVTSFVLAAIGVAVLVLLVEGRPSPTTSGTTTSDTTTAGTTTAPKVDLRAVVAAIREPRFARLLLAGGMLALFAVNDGFVYLLVQRRGALPVETVALMPVAAAFVFMILARPLGRLVDRDRPLAALLAGQMALAILYAVLSLSPPAWLGASTTVVLIGIFYAATDGVLAAWASARLPPSLRTVGLSVVTAVTSVARILSAMAFGALWDETGTRVPFVVFSAGAIASTVVAGLVLRDDARIGS